MAHRPVQSALAAQPCQRSDHALKAASCATGACSPCSVLCVTMHKQLFYNRAPSHLWTPLQRSAGSRACSRPRGSALASAGAAGYPLHPDPADGRHASISPSCNNHPTWAQEQQQQQQHHQQHGILAVLPAAISQPLQRVSSLTGRFLPMVTLFFLLSFVNTLLDSLKDTLVITAVGGGAQVIPYLTVYAVLPSSLLFLLAYSSASQHLSRGALFNSIIAVFCAFFVSFGFILLPNQAALHPDLAILSKLLPPGLGGLVGMVRNWTFTLFFCAAELWGDVCLGLLFWGLANDTTSLGDAKTLYPLFGLGANAAQALGGFALKSFSGSRYSAASFATQVQGFMIAVLVCAGGAVALHSYIDRSERAGKQLASDRQQEQRARLQALAPQGQRQRGQGDGLEERSAGSSSSSRSSYSNRDDGRTSSSVGSSGSTYGTLDHAHAVVDGICSSTTSDLGTRASSSRGGDTLQEGGRSGSDSGMDSDSGDSRRDDPSTSTSGHTSTNGSGAAKEKRMSLQEIYSALAASTPIKCLAIMALAQGLCTNLMEFAWKSHIRLLYSNPADFTAFLGEVAAWQGIVTGGLMVLSPALFTRLGWKGVAAATPNILLTGGIAFFSACLLYECHHLLAGHGAMASAAAALGGSQAMLAGLVYGGAALYTFSKSAKFSLFKPATEMVYISLDAHGRTKGKAAIDVAATSAGKSGGSLLQQLLLLVSGGAMVGSLPIMFGVFVVMAQGWLRAVQTLAKYNPQYGQPESVHQSLARHDSGSEGVNDSHAPTHTGNGASEAETASVGQAQLCRDARHASPAESGESSCACEDGGMSRADAVAGTHQQWGDDGIGVSASMQHQDQDAAGDRNHHQQWHQEQLLHNNIVAGSGLSSHAASPVSGSALHGNGIGGAHQYSSVSSAAIGTAIGGACGCARATAAHSSWLAGRASVNGSGPLASSTAGAASAVASLSAEQLL